MKRSSLLLIALVIVSTVFGIFFIHPDYLGKTLRPWRLGLDLVGGTHLVYEINMKDVVEADRKVVLDGIRNRIENRINSSGIYEPQVLTAKSGDTYRLIVDIAGVKDTSAAINQIGQTPFLVFSSEGQAANLPVTIQTDQGPVTGSAQQEATWRPSMLTGRYVKNAQLILNQYTGAPEISLEFDSEGATIFETLTGENIGKRLAIFVDDQLLSAPVVNERIVGGRAQISGQFTIKEAQLLVSRFKDGALAAPLTLVSQQTIGATLGSDSLASTLWAGLIGSLLIMLFMMLYYRSLGVFSSIALLIYTVLLLAVFKLLGVTMTLSGIAGLILSIGMAVDANVLIFERSKEEMVKGGNRHTAIIEGFKRAWPSIRDSNITTMITSFVLYSFASSFIKGFALSLLLGVVISMFTAITVTRVLLEIFIKEKKQIKTA